jgi:hypothetical protein
MYHKLQVRSEAKTSKAFKAASDIRQCAGTDSSPHPGLAQNESYGELVVFIELKLA